LTVIVTLTDTDGPEDLVSWAESFGVTHPIGGDYDYAVWNTYSVLSIGRPQYIVIDRSFTVVEASNVGAEAEALAATLL
jgi:hypothetical protein